VPFALVLSGGSADEVDGLGCEVADIEQQLIVGVPDAGAELGGAIEQQLGTTGLGAATPAMSDPSPSF
jgi:hypothetical protein